MKPNINHKCPTCGLGSNIDRICTNCFYIYNPYKHGNCLRCMRTARMRTTKPLNDRMVDFIRTTIPKAEDNKSDRCSCCGHNFDTHLDHCIEVVKGRAQGECGCKKKGVKC